MARYVILAEDSGRKIGLRTVVRVPDAEMAAGVWDMAVSGSDGIMSAWVGFAIFQPVGFDGRRLFRSWRMSRVAATETLAHATARDLCVS